MPVFEYFWGGLYTELKYIHYLVLPNYSLIKRYSK